MPPPSPQHSCIDLSDLKVQIEGKLGPERAQRYFNYLNRLLGQKLSKYEFEKLCSTTLGRENIPLHNQFIRSILRNAYQRRAATPAVHDKDVLKPSGAAGKISPLTDDGSRPSLSSVPTPLVWSNGDILPPSPRKSRTTNRRIKDRPSPLRPNGKTDSIARLRAPSEEAVVRENGDLVTCDVRKSAAPQQGGPAELPMKKQRIEKPPPSDRISVESVPGKDSAKDGEEMAKIEPAESNRGPFRAPLGIPFCPASVGGACRPVSSSACSTSGGFASNYCSDELCRTEALRKHMEHIAEAQGLVGGVARDCANLLNNGLDAYLKRLIRSCVDLVGSRPVNEPIKHPVFKQQAHLKNLNGIWPRNHINIQSTIGALEGMQEPKKQHPVSMLDFRVAMELNPQQLGEDWPLLLEKICHRSFEE